MIYTVYTSHVDCHVDRGTTNEDSQYTRNSFLYHLIGILLITIKYMESNKQLDNRGVQNATAIVIISRDDMSH